MALTAIAVSAAPAGAASKRALLGPFPPVFSSATGLAVDQTSGDLLVIDASAKTVSRWHQDGTPSNFTALGTNVIDAKLGAGGKACGEEPSSCDDTPQHGFTFGEGREVQVAIDESGSATNGNIYVTQIEKRLVDVFAADGRYLGQLTKYLNANSEEKPFGETCGVAVDQSGALYVSDYNNGVHKFIPSANPPITADNTANFGAVIQTCTVAAGAGPTEGFIFVAKWARDFVAKINSTTGALACRISNGNLTVPAKPRVEAVTTDPVSGHVFVVKNGPGEVAEYDGTCPPDPETDAEVVSLASLASTGKGAAVDGASDQIYVSRQSSAKVEIFGPPVPLPAVVTSPATPIGETSATLRGTVDPEGFEIEECAFEYGTTEAYGATVPCVESVAEIGTGNAPMAVHADISGLEAGGLYHYRLIARNLSGTSKGKDEEFATRVRPLIEDEWVAGATYTGATVRAKINPRFYPTTFHVEYGPDEAYGLSTPEIAVGFDNAVHTVTAPLSGLQAGATYHWRVVASSENGESEGVGGVLHTYAQPGPDACPNAAFRIGPGAQLLDCRAYEMVSPVDKNGGDIVAAEIPGGGGTSGFFQAAEDGGKITYTSATAFGDAVRGAFANQYIATRGGASWASRALNPAQGTTVFDVAGTDLGSRLYLDTGTGFEAFTPDLCRALMVDWNFDLLTADALPAYTNLYWRENCGPGAGNYEALTRAEEIVEPPLDSGFGANLFLESRNYTPDLDHVVFSSKGALTTDAAPAASARNQIYTRSASGLRLVSVLPGGKGASPDNNMVGTGNSRHSASLATAVSEDGSRVFWSTNIAEGPIDVTGNIYMRVNPAEEQSALDSGGNCTEADKACTVAVVEAPGSTQGRFWMASEDGSKAIISVGPGTDLYEIDVDEAIAEGTEAAKTLIAAEAGGVVGASEDLSYLYFTSKKALDEGAVAGEWNLYLRHNGTVSLIATILPIDQGSSGIDTLNAQLRSSRVSADGRRLAFMSAARLTAYDNADTATGEAASEVYRYDADNGQLSCASCNPSEARPLGRERPPNGFGRQTAAWIPGWEWSNHGGRVLSEDGNRLFFNAFDALVPADTNSAQDVYEWEAPGTGNCDTEAPSYSALNDGCLSLISTGRSGDESTFVDASANGNDVFISTNSSIDPRDPGLIDIYDARQAGGYPQAIAEPTPCVGDACQTIPGPPDHPTPPSSVPAGDGNLHKPPPSKPCGKGKRRVVRNGKSRCVAKHKRRQRRANHNRRAAR